MAEIISISSADNETNNCPLETRFDIEFINVQSIEENCNDCYKEREIKVKNEFNEEENAKDVFSTENANRPENLSTNLENEKNNPLASEREIKFINVEKISNIEDKNKSKIVKEENIESNLETENESDRVEVETIKIERNNVFFKEHTVSKKRSKRISKEKKIRCTYPGCKIKFAKPSKLNRHLCMHTGERPFVCNFKDCDKAYTNNSYLRRHKLTHNEIKEKFLCTYCKAPFSSPHNLKRHSSRVHENPLSLQKKCAECQFVCLTRKVLSKHMKKIHQRNLYQCNFCPKSFKEPSSLQRHLNTNMHKTFTCKICLTTFDKHAEFREHKKEHIVVYKEFTCYICELKFNHKGNLRLHLQGHESSNIFVCSYEGCNRIYSFQRNLDTHIISFHLGKKWECHLCQMKLSSKQKLNSHIEKIHINPVPRKPQATKENRKRRWDIGIPRKSAISKICGLLLPAKTEKIIIYRQDIKCEKP